MLFHEYFQPPRFRISVLFLKIRIPLCSRGLTLQGGRRAHMMRCTLLLLCHHPHRHINALLFDVVHTLHATSFNRAECTVLKINLCPSTSCAAAAHTVPHHQRLTCELGPMLLTRSPKQMGGHIFEGYMTEKSLKNEERRHFNKYEIRSHL